MCFERNIKWRHISIDLVHALAEGRWHDNDKIPTENQLTTTYQCSRTTLRKAIDELCHLRLLHRRAPHGTFVAAGARQRAQTLLPDGPPPTTER
jgi:GntR family histidine utilization transcriptional repressor